MMMIVPSPPLPFESHMSYGQVASGGGCNNWVRMTPITRLINAPVGRLHFQRDPQKETHFRFSFLPPVCVWLRHPID